MRTVVALVALFLIVFLPTVGCSGQPITFSGQASPLSGFSHDTGLQPTGSPVQLDLKLSANGTVSVSAQTNVQDTSLAPIAQSGNLSLDLHFVAAGELKIDSTFENYDGPSRASTTSTSRRPARRRSIRSCSAPATAPS